MYVHQSNRNDGYDKLLHYTISEIHSIISHFNTTGFLQPRYAIESQRILPKNLGMPQCDM